MAPSSMLPCMFPFWLIPTCPFKDSSRELEVGIQLTVSVVYAGTTSSYSEVS